MAGLGVTGFNLMQGGWRIIGVMADEKIFLMDGSTFLFRAFHAMRVPLRTREGRATQAIYGFVNMLRGVLREYAPERLAVVLDAKGKTFRSDLYAEYKANRPPMDEDLRAQQEVVKEIVPALGIRLLSVTGVEADDVIGTLARAGSAAGREVVIFSGDKDLAQLVDERVVMVDTMRKTRLDVAGVREKFGVPPEQIVELLALMGDASDNIPGVPMVGAKTAVKWLGEFGSLDAVVRRADEIPGKVGESLRGNLGQLALAKELATIKCDVEVGVGLEDLRIGERDVGRLRELYGELEFQGWLKELEGELEGEGGEVGAGGADSEAGAGTGRYEVIGDEGALRRWVGRLEGCEVFALRVETGWGLKKVKKPEGEEGEGMEYFAAELTGGTGREGMAAGALGGEDLVGIGFAVGGGEGEVEAGYLPLGHRDGKELRGGQVEVTRALELVRGVLEDAKRGKVLHDGKFDFAVLERAGINLRGVVGDTMVMGYVLEAGRGRYDLESHLQRRRRAGDFQGGVEFFRVREGGAGRTNFSDVEVEQAGAFVNRAMDLMWRVWGELGERLAGEAGLGRVYAEIEMPLGAVLARVERNGVRVDGWMLRRLSGEIGERLVGIEEEAYAIAGEKFNMASPKQIQEILYVKGGIAVVKKTPKGQPSTAESVLQELAAEHSLPRLILQYRGLAKLKSTYTDKLPMLVHGGSGRIHTSYHQAGAATGRLSSSEPNLQNIPVRTEDGRRIREAFVAEEGRVLVCADYSQVELRIMAHLSGDKGLREAFLQGRDVHAATAAEVFGVGLEGVSDAQRRSAKAINFGLIYGMSAFGLARQLGIEPHRAREYMEVYFERYPGVREYMERTKKEAKGRGFVETMFGRRVYLPDIGARNAQVRQYAERAAINAPMQGSAADLIKMAMVRVDGWLGEGRVGGKMIMQVHDELVLEVVAGEAEGVAREVAGLMEGVAELSVPLVVDTGVGGSWREAH